MTTLLIICEVKLWKIGLILSVKKVKPDERRVPKELRKRKGEVAITLKEKRMRDYMDGSQEEAVSKRKAVKPKVVGLLVELVTKKEDQNLAVEQMHLREEKEDVDLLVPLVKHIKEGRVHHELGNNIKRNGLS
jgi:hypothetical protein|tara:strand:- start:3328 stop:3726 length:399 start_codon:yes stop_codon:yes gene_type:complete